MTHQEDDVTPAGRFLDAWLDATATMTEGIVEANRALLTAGGDHDPVADGSGCTHETDDTAEGVAFTEESWTVETDFAEAGTVSVGDEVRFAKPLTDADVETFATVSGDTNRLHLDEEFADGTRFGGRIAHGTLVSGLISAALARLPGVVVYLSQETSFVGPVDPGQRAAAEVEVLEDLGDRQYRLSTDVYADGERVVEGEAVVLVDELPDDA